MTTVFLALGSNLGDRMVNLTQALTLLPPQITLEKASRVFETPPWGVTDQPAFLNMVVSAETSLAPLDLLDRLKFLEEKIGRQKSIRYGPRTIDLDILFYNGIVYHNPRLDIPHLRVPERAFVLVPMTDLASDLEHPVLHQTIQQLAVKVDSAGINPVTTIENNPPGEISLALQAQPVLLERYQHLPPSHQWEYLKYILEARKPVTRQRRLQAMAAKLSGSKDQS